jgi:mannose-1-phosphate guanylyltransferase
MLLPRGGVDFGMDRPLVAVVLAGGIGSRLYPASRSHRPKQFLALDGEQSLLTRTVERAAFADRILVVTREEYTEQARDHVGRAHEHDEQAPDRAEDNQAGDVSPQANDVSPQANDVSPQADLPPTEVVAEPAGRDTGPALLYATHLARDREERPVVLALPSDHRIGDGFDAVGRRAARAAVEADSLVAVGITPTRPETGYGYIKPGADHDWYREAVTFHEKPDEATAEAYVEAGHLWNAGIFAWTPETLFEAARDSPLSPLVAALAADSPARGFQQVDPVSIDYAVMEHANDVALVPADLAWDDLGAWDALPRVHEADADGNVTLGESLTIDAANNVVVGEDAHVSLVGVDGLAVVAWDDRVLVVPTEHAQRVRDVVNRLRAADEF